MSSMSRDRSSRNRSLRNFLSPHSVARRRLALCPGGRQLRLEPLEDRAMLSALPIAFGGSGTVTDAYLPDSVLYVDQDAGGGANDGTSWTDAFVDLQTALLVADTGDEIWVAKGTYHPTADADRTVSFDLKAGVDLYGGFAGTETTLEQRDWTTNATLLSGDLNGDDGSDGDNSENSYRVVTANAVSDASIDGFTISGGNDDGYKWGGGMHCENSSLTVSNVVFSGNTSTVHGGGMYNKSCSPTLTNVVFIGNTSDWQGGAMENVDSSPTLTDVLFSNNSAGDGGGMFNSGNSSPVLTRVTFDGNWATDALGYGLGGGMRNDYSSSPILTDVTFTGNSAKYGGGMYSISGSPTLTNVTFSGNSASKWGGGMYNRSNSPTLTDVTFAENSAYSSSTGDGGGLFNYESSPTLTNVTFIDNSARYSGGGMYNKYYSFPILTNVVFSGNWLHYGYGGAMFNDESSVTLTNVTMSENVGKQWGGAIYNDRSVLTLTNGVLWGNVASESGSEQIYNSRGGTATVTYSLVEGGWTGVGNVDADPLFVDSATGNVRLQPGSPAIDAGTATGAPGFDLDGNSRPLDGDGDGTPGFDMGAYELLLVNQPPVADAGGPYSVPELGNVVLSGAGSSDADGSIVLYEWDLDYNGATFDVNATGETAEFSAAAIAGPASRTVALRVADDDNALSPIATATVTITDAYPADSVLYVNQDAGGGANDGTSWADAFVDLQTALFVADAGDEIWVAEGTYVPDRGTGNRAHSFNLKTGIHLYGGFEGTESSRDQRDWAQFVTTLSGDIGTSGETSDNSYHVLRAPGDWSTSLYDIRLDGFVVSDGNADGTHWYAYDRGAGLYATLSSMMISNVTFRDNAADQGGAVIHFYSAPTYTNVTFENNSACDGGAIFNNGNSSNPHLINVVFIGNSADSGGGAMYNNDACSPVLTNVAFIDNSAGFRGGAMHTHTGSPVLTNVTFTGNSAISRGGAMNTYSGSPSVTNSILWGNTATDGAQINGAATVTYSIVEGDFAGEGNLAIDPLFVDPAAGNLRLQTHSPGIDTGTATNAPSFDLDGNPRPLDGDGDGTPEYDMGAYEFHNEPPVADAGGPYTGHEGSPVTFDASGSSDPDGNPLQYRWDFDDDGTWDTSWSADPTASYTWSDDHAGFVAVEVSDGQSTDTSTAMVTVDNEVPIVTAAGNQTTSEGATTTFSLGLFTDPGDDTWDIAVSWGDGTTDETFMVSSPGDLGTFVHAYADNGTYRVTIGVRDDDMLATDPDWWIESFFDVLVENIPAQLDNVSVTSPIDENTQAVLTGDFVDPGTQDAFTLSVDWADGAREIHEYPPGTESFTLSHRYLDNGDFAVNLMVNDTDSGRPYDLTVSADQPVAYWRLGEATGPTATDQTGNYDGTYVNVQAAHFGADGAIRNDEDTAVEFAGGRAQTPAIGLLNSFSIETWLFADNLGGFRALYDVDSYSNLGVHYQFAGSQIELYVSSGFSTRFYTSFLTNRWYHVVTAYDAIEGGLKLFVDGQLTESHGIPAGRSANFSEANIGSWNEGRLFDGRLDEVAIYDSALTETQVREHYEVGLNLLDAFCTTATVRVENVDPVLAGPDPVSLNENAVARLNVGISDQGVQDTFVLEVDWADGVTQSFDLPAGTTEFELVHHYPDDGLSSAPSDDYPVQLTLTDDDGGTATAQTTVTVNNVEPTLQRVAYKDTVLSDDPVALWRLGEASGPTAADATGHGYDGTYVNLAAENFGQSGALQDDPDTAVLFDGLDDRVAVPALGTFGSFTIETWLNADAFTGYWNAIYDTNSFSTGSIHYQFYRNTPRIELAIGSRLNAVFNYEFDTNTWYHVVTAYDGDTGALSFYVGGQLQQHWTAAQGIETVFSAANLGSWNSGRCLEGLLDELSIYDVALTAAQVQQHYRAGTGVWQPLAATDVSEGGVSTLSGTVTDPSPLDVVTLDVDWGDPLTLPNTQSFTLGTAVLTKGNDGIDWDPATRQFEIDHAYPDDNPGGTSSDDHIITVTLTDDDTGSMTGSTSVTVDNVSPVFDAGPNVTLDVPDSGVFSRPGITFTDPGTDAWSGTVLWGDSPTPETLLVDQGNRQFDLNHTYTTEGTYTVTVTVADDDGGERVDSFEIEVHLNTPPVANDQVVTALEDTATLITLTASDEDEDPLTFSVVSGPSHGTLSGFDPDTGEVTYIPNPDYHGGDSFTFKVNDGTVDSTDATVSITVDPVADIADDDVTMNEDTSANIDVLDNDSFADAVAYVSGVTQGVNGSVTIEADGTVTYTPDSDFHGTDSFTYTVTTSTPANTETAVVNVTVRSAQQQIDEVLIPAIEDLVTSGILNGGQGNSLLSKLEGATAKFDQAKTNAGINQMEAFINQVEAFVQSGKLTPEEGQTLINAAEAVILSALPAAEAEATDAALAALGEDDPLLDPLLDDSVSVDSSDGKGKGNK